MSRIIFNAPVNNLSFGNVSYNMLRELYKRDIPVSYFPISERLDFSSFDKVDKDFVSWVESSAREALLTVKRDAPTLKMWHINSSNSMLSPRQYLYTFHELNTATPIERNIVDMQEHTFFSSSYSKSVFKRAGCDRVSNIPIGFDEDFHETGKSYLKDVVHFVLMGKFEKRKHTQRIIQAWAQKYGNNKDYQLSCCVTNPFFKPEQMQQIINNTLQGKRFFNINFLPYLKTNSEVNDLLNSADINLTGLSGAEGWNLPAFNSACLGKWSIVLNCTSHKDWATKDNCVLIEPDGTEPVYDQVFFQEGQAFNQGDIYNFTAENMNKALDQAVKICKTENTKGRELKNTFSYSNTMDSILKTMGV